MAAKVELDCEDGEEELELEEEFEMKRLPPQMDWA
jgi:hypothetical protein